MKKITPIALSDRVAQRLIGKQKQNPIRPSKITVYDKFVNFYKIILKIITMMICD